MGLSLKQTQNVMDATTQELITRQGLAWSHCVTSAKDVSYMFIWVYLSVSKKTSNVLEIFRENLQEMLMLTRGTSY